MTENTREFVSSIGIKWIKSDSGNTYLCQASAIDGMSNPSEEDLRNACQSESDNPQND